MARKGGLSREKDYGSKKKPYPKVQSKDFAGKGRKYPIPTKADARDALRLAGLQGRDDVKAKVYNRYPSLKKLPYGGVVEGDTVMVQTPQGPVARDLRTEADSLANEYTHLPWMGNLGYDPKLEMESNQSGRARIYPTVIDRGDGNPVPY